MPSLWEERIKWALYGLLFGATVASGVWTACVH